jgi:hypothetical protein
MFQRLVEAMEDSIMIQMLTPDAWRHGILRWSLETRAHAAPWLPDEAA